jgi:hypothetical protein
MRYIEFIARFPESGLIGQDITDDEAVSYFWNGIDVGCWRVDRRTTIGRGGILGIQDAAAAREYYKTKRISRQR